MPFHLHIISYHITSCGVVSCPRERSSNRRSVEVIFRSFTPPTHPQNDQRFYFIHPHHYNRAEQVSLICGRCLCAINRHSSNKDDGEVEDNDISSALYPAMHRSTHQDSPFPTVNCSMFFRHQTLIHISIRYRWQSHIRICPHLFFLLPKENGSLICAANATKSLHSRIIVQRPTLLFH